MTIKLSDQMTDHEYHSSPGVTFHRLKEYMGRGPLWYNGRYVTGAIPPPPDKDWGLLGRAYHVYGLEGERAFLEQVTATPVTYMTEPPIEAPWNPRTKFCKEWTKANPDKPTPATYLDGEPSVQKPWNSNANVCKEWEARVKPGTIILSPSDYSAAMAIGRNMRSNEHAARLLGMGWPEITISQTDERFPVPIKGRIDWLASTSTSMEDAWAICDPKGTNDLDQFPREAIKFGYHRQMAFYRSLVFHEIGKLLPVFLVALEKEGMHRVRVWQVDPELLDIGNDQNERDLEHLAASYKMNHWPLDADPSMRVLTTPPWMKPQPDGMPQSPAPWEI